MIGQISASNQLRTCSEPAAFAATSSLLCRQEPTVCLWDFTITTLYIFSSMTQTMLTSLYKNFSTSVLTGWVLHGSLLHSVLEHGNFSNIDISQGSVVTRLRCDRVFNDFIAKLLISLSVKEFWKSISIWRSYRQDYGGTFFLTHSVY